MFIARAQKSSNKIKEFVPLLLTQNEKKSKTITKIFDDRSGLNLIEVEVFVTSSNAVRAR